MALFVTVRLVRIGDQWMNPLHIVRVSRAARTEVIIAGGGVIYDDRPLGEVVKAIHGEAEPLPSLEPFNGPKREGA